MARARTRSRLRARRSRMPESHPRRQRPPIVELRDATVVDKVYQDFTKLKNSRRLSAQDKQLVDQFATLFQDLNNRLKSTPGQAVTCTKPGAPASSPGNNSQDPADIRAKWSAFIDIIVAAILCDRTRVFTLDVRKVVTASGALFHNPDGVGGSRRRFPHGLRSRSLSNAAEQRPGPESAARRARAMAPGDPPGRRRTGRWQARDLQARRALSRGPLRGRAPALDAAGRPLQTLSRATRSRHRRGRSAGTVPRRAAGQVARSDCSRRRRVERARIDI